MKKILFLLLVLCTKTLPTTTVRSFYKDDKIIGIETVYSNGSKKIERTKTDGFFFFKKQFIKSEKHVEENCSKIVHDFNTQNNCVFVGLFVQLLKKPFYNRILKDLNSKSDRTETHTE